jgi:SPP1 family predicted phage head-tail adaptor
MPASVLINPRLMRSLRRHFNSRATIQNGTTTYNSHNEPVTVWNDDPLLKQLSCYIEPASGGEQRQAGNTLVTNLWNVLIAGFYPNISDQQQITIDGIVYNITDVSTESTDTVTAIVVEKVTL